MNLLVKRHTFSDLSTIGDLYLDDVKFCNTLEPRRDQAQGKPYCIPEGNYCLWYLHSNRFGIYMLHVVDVPFFDGILIHAGNNNFETAGCLLVGDSIGPQPDWINHSRVTLSSLLQRLQPQQDKQVGIITYQNAA
jgi:Family of unknown function (DUF5675)